MTFVPLAPEAVLDVESLYQQHELPLAPPPCLLSLQLAAYNNPENSPLLKAEQRRTQQRLKRRR